MRSQAWPLHQIKLARLEHEHETEQQDGGHVDPKQLHRENGQRNADQYCGQNDQPLAEVGRQRPDDKLVEVVEFNRNQAVLFAVTSDGPPLSET